jgi:hypothetical protein
MWLVPKVVTTRRADNEMVLIKGRDQLAFGNTLSHMQQDGMSSWPQILQRCMRKWLYKLLGAWASSKDREGGPVKATEEMSAGTTRMPAAQFRSEGMRCWHEVFGNENAVPSRNEKE